MASYSTIQMFAGRRARVGDIVILAGRSHDGGDKMCLRAGVVVAICSSQDRPFLLDLRNNSVDWVDPAWKFVATPSDRSIQLEMEALPIGSWTWPVKGA